MFAKMTAIRRPRLLSVSAEHRIVILITFLQPNSLYLIDYLLLMR